ncbi:MAG: YceI family protein [Sphingobacteriales bacterium]|nr:YceI family protein [Sphingobacteriales bacterium]
MKQFIIVLFLIFRFQELSAQDYRAKEIYIHFFSPAPIADIEAISNRAVADLHLAKKEVEMTINIASFKFKKALMQTHFNEKYMESDKFPTASFKGKFIDNFNLNKDGVYQFNVEGKFKIHGVEKNKTVPCKIIVKDQKIVLETKFKLLSADFKIKAPDIIYRKVGQEVTIDVTGILVKE